KELQIIKDKLDEEGLILEQKIGLAGTSMGGITTSAALTKYSWINTAAILMGTPKLTDYANLLVENVVKTEKLPIPEKEIKRLMNQIKTYDLSLQMEKLKQRPLMFWHGDKDSDVPCDLSYTFYKDVKKKYKNKKKKYKNKDDVIIIKEKDHDHKVSRFAIIETVNWFESQLNRNK